MKSKNYKIFAWIATALFLLISVKLFYDFYMLDSQIVEALNVVEINKKRTLNSIVLVPFTSFGLAFFMAILAILLINIAGTARFAEGIVLGEIKDEAISSTKEKLKESQTQKYASSTISMTEVHKILAEYTGRERFERILSLICKNLEAAQGAIFWAKKENGHKYFVFQAGYAYYMTQTQKLEYEEGEGLIGQVGKDGISLLLKEVPEGYIKVISGLGESSPRNLLIMPITDKNAKEIVGVIELASFTPFTELQKSLIQQVLSMLVEQTETVDTVI